MKLENYIHKLIQNEITPGISLLVGRGDSILYNKHFGYKARKPEVELLSEGDIYDIASLTKPLITAFLTVYLIERGLLELCTPASKILPGINENIQIQHLLTHTSGLPAWYPFYLSDFDYLSQIRSLDLIAKPGKKVIYSCVGYILLFYIIENIIKSKFKRFAKEIIIDPLNLKDTFFSPPGNIKQRVAPTEKGSRFEKKLAEKDFAELIERFEWRPGIIRGETHDANSYYLGGTAGNSGLFSNCPDLFRLAREFFPNSCTLLKTDSLSYFWHNFTPGKGSHRSIGFKLNSSLLSSGGRALRKDAIGHNGFTGTSIWLEPETNCVYILLSNRIHPRVKSTNFNRVRRKLHALLRDVIK